MIGLGAMGSAAAYHLARRGRRVVAFEQFEPGHDRGSSHGESRAIRLAYFEHPSYVPLARRAYAGWRALERAAGRTVLTVTGILEAGQPGSAVVDGSLAASREHGLPHEVLDFRAIARRFPAFRVPPDWYGVFQPDGGFLRPELAIELFMAGAQAAGAHLLHHTAVHAIEPGPSAVLVRAGETVVHAGAVIVAAGPWIGELIPLLRPHLTLTEQVLGWFGPAGDPWLVAPDRCPVFIFDAPDDTCYGFPDFAGTGVKVASHRPIRTITRPGDVRRELGSDDEARLRNFLARYVPAAAGTFRAAKSCIYTRTRAEDFILDTHPDDSRIVLASPCSGHGFKFAPVIGEILADLALHGSTPLDITRFGLQRLRMGAASPHPETTVLDV